MYLPTRCVLPKNKNTWTRFQELECPRENINSFPGKCHIETSQVICTVNPLDWGLDGRNTGWKWVKEQETFSSQYILA